MSVHRSLLFAAASVLLTSGLLAAPPESLELSAPTAPEEVKIFGPSCGAFDLYEQPLGMFGTARTSDGATGPPPFEVAEAHLVGGAIAPIGGSVGQVRVWGIDVDFTGGAGPCVAPEPTAPFTVTFYEDAGGTPGAQVAQATGVVGVVVETGIPFAFTTIQQYDLVFPPVDATNAAWVGVLREPGPDAACTFLWVDETDAALYDNQAFQFNGTPPFDTDQAFCLGGMAEPQLVLESTSTIDQCNSDPGNENGVPEPGDGIYLEVTLEARNGPRTNLSCIASSSDPAVDLVLGFESSTFPDAMAGETTTNESFFAIRQFAACGSTVTLDLDCTSDQGDESFTVEIPVGAAPMSPMNTAIPDNDPSGVTIPLQVERDVTLTDVDVRVEVEHTWVGDVTVELRPPGGGSIVLLDRPGFPATMFGCDDNDFEITFDDSAGTTSAALEGTCSGSNATPWFVGSAQPIDPLATLAGTSSQGTWELFVTDSAAGDPGTVVEWQLITPEELGVCEICDNPGPPFEPDVECLTCVPIPTLDEIGMGFLALLLAAGAVMTLRRRS